MYAEHPNLTLPYVTVFLLKSAELMQLLVARTQATATEISPLLVIPLVIPLNKIILFVSQIVESLQ